MINCEWGIEGINKYSTVSDVTIIIDILSFSTCVDIALSNNAAVFPYRYKDDSVFEYAKANNAVPASLNRSKENISLSTVSLKNIKNGTRIVLPSPNGSELSMSSGSKTTLCACLRNYRAVAEYACSISNNIAVIPAGEKWQDGTIRFAIEDYLGAGAVISCLKGELSPEAEAASALFKTLMPDINKIIIESISGKELIERGFPEDVSASLQLNAGGSIPLLVNNCYINAVNL